MRKRKVAVVNKQHHVSKGLKMGLLQSGKINDIFKNLRVFTTEKKRQEGSGRKREVNFSNIMIPSVQKHHLHNE